MDFSIIVPVLNEINYIDDLAASLNIKDGVKKEIFFTDGGSTDGTRMRHWSVVHGRWFSLD